MDRTINNKGWLAQRWLSAWIAVGTGIMGLLVALIFPVDFVIPFTSEEGPVEMANALLFGVSLAALVMYRDVVVNWKVWLALAILIIACAARELDLHRYWTQGESALKVSFMLGSAPLRQRLTTVLVVFCVLGAIAYLVFAHGRAIWRHIRQRDALGIAVASFLGAVIVSKVFDRSGNILMEDYGVDLPLAVRALIVSVEEFLEMSLPLIIVVGLYQLTLERTSHPA